MRGEEKGMSLEDAITRLAIAIEAQGEASAVAELIRQKKNAEAARDKWKRDAEFYEERRTTIYKEWEVTLRRIASLKGVITRMKKAKANQ
jgi:hypothetical protein